MLRRLEWQKQLSLLQLGVRRSLPLVPSVPVPPVPVPPVPVPRSVSFSENIHTDNILYKNRFKVLDMFDSDSDSDSDDGMPVVDPVPSVSPPVAPVSVSAPVASAPDVHNPPAVQWPLDFDNDPVSEDPPFWSDDEPVHIDPSEALNVLYPPPSPTGSDYVLDIRNDESATQDTQDPPPASQSGGPPPVNPTGRPVRNSAIRSGKYDFGLARTINTLTNSAIRKFSAFTAHVALVTTQIGTPICQ
jgi:hypothetical protein